MEQIFKQPYEISLWKDVLTFITDQGEYEGTLPEGCIVLQQYYKEKKIAIIGSHVMDSPIRAFNPKLTSNINGTKNLTFQMFFKYYDEETGSQLENPFIPFMVNERKIKLKLGSKEQGNLQWYDFVIKDIQEDSKTKVFTYTAKDLFVNELSKTGFELEFNTKLGNNIGNIYELGEKILKGSDWRLRNEGMVLKQTREEPLYEAKLISPIMATNLGKKQMITLTEKEYVPNKYYVYNSITNNYNICSEENYNSSYIYYTEEISEIPKGSIIYIFYSVIENKEEFFQFIYSPEKIQIDSKNVIINKDTNWFINVVYDKNGQPLYDQSVIFLDNVYNEVFLSEEEYEPNKYYYYDEVLKKYLICSEENFDKQKKYFVIIDGKISDTYRGKRLVRKPLVKFDPTIEKYVNLYDYDNIELYGFKENEYLSPTCVQSYVTNGKDFSSQVGWEVGKDASVLVDLPKIEITTIPDVKKVDSDFTGDFISYLKFQSDSTHQILCNSGVSDYKHAIENFVKGEEYVFRSKFGILKRTFNEEKIVTTGLKMKVKVATYDIDSDGKYTFLNELFSSELAYDSADVQLSDDENNYVQSFEKAKNSFSYNDLGGKKIGLFISFEQPGTYYLQDFQFFKLKKRKEQIILPNQSQLFAETQTMYYYYQQNDNYKSLDDVQFFYKGSKPLEGANVRYNSESFEKRRTIEASQTNRYNLLGKLCELFECWVSFIIDHEDDGTIKLDVNKRQIKEVVFKDYIGKENFSGFKYGINLKSIVRKIESDGTISKIVVKSNSNQFGDNGFCTIARAEENFCKENFIYNFGYYIQNKLLTFNAVNNDLFMPRYADLKNKIRMPQKYIGYYKQLRYYNQERDKYIDEQATLVKDIPKYNSSYQTNLSAANNAAEGSRDKQIDLERLTSLDYDYLMKHKENSYWDNDKVLELMVSITQYKNSEKKYRKISEQSKQLLNSAEEKFVQNRDKLKQLAEKKELLHQEFYSKYARFIQEGSWIKEDYVDDNLYYLDAESVLYQASQPKVSYTINVLDLSQLEEYSGYKFDIGDKTYIQDLEFFGWDFNASAPYKEEIVVTEITLSLDAPEQNVVKVQNYKDQFDDLFQRITATTQALEYQSGKYNKTSSTITEEGKIKVSVLQNSIAGNSLKIQNAKDQSVIWDETGITTTCLSNPSEIVRIFSGGIMLSKDGGNSWVTGISGDGINANYIVTGELNTNKIKILNGTHASFVWNESGLNAYYYETDPKTGIPTGYNPNKFVRFDHHGIYTVDSKIEYNPDLSDDPEKKIQQDSNFSLTWSGFQIHSQHKDGGQIRITPNNDFQVIRKIQTTEQELIKIGLLSEDGGSSIYGIRIKDGLDNIVLESGNDGSLWLKNILHVGAEEKEANKVYIGALPRKQFAPNLEDANQVINANNNFIVYSDGSVIAEKGTFKGRIEADSGTFKGRIEADSGRIGNLDISEIEGNAEKVELYSEKGTIFKVNEFSYSPEQLEIKAKIEGVKREQIASITWRGGEDFGVWKDLKTYSANEVPEIDKIEYILTYDFFKQETKKDNYYIMIEIKTTNSTIPLLSSYLNIIRVTDGTAKEDVQLVIFSSNGNFFRNYAGSTELTAKLYKGGQEIDDSGQEGYLYTWTDDKGTLSKSGKVITIDATEVEKTSVITCKVTKKEII